MISTEMDKADDSLLKKKQIGDQDKDSRVQQFIMEPDMAGPLKNESIQESDIGLYKSGQLSKSFYACSFCKTNFFNPDQLDMHFIMAHEREKLICNECSEKFQKMSELCDHMLTHDQYLCYVCGFRFTNKVQFDEHKASHSKGIKVNMCKFCGKTFTYVSNFFAHSRTCSLMSKRFLCGTCGKLFKCKRYLVEHIKGHENPERFQCATCGSVFAYRGTLYRHMQKSGHK